ncbi:histidine-type phosphatase [uncultured Paludibaculum sp.]|uniref:histidine-type phosphatase n=1 Tax=uncultured Paludibaculum sp. TaxID=1765020 RepID=UPI002AAB902E|nr:histidine-type phosphatase [uncultured Paludibaculum sp.]
MKTTFLRLVALTLLCVPFAAAQHADDTKLRQVIIFGRHSVRAPVAPNSLIDTFAARPFPIPSVGTGILTANGAKLESLLGTYYRLWLTKEGLLTGNDEADAAFVYFRANTLERTRVTAQSFATGLLPAAAVTVNTYPDSQSDPLFDPIGAGVARLDQKKAVQAVKGRLGGDGQLVTSAYAPELALARSVLLGYPLSQTPPPAAPKGVIDVTALPIEITAGAPVNIGGLSPISGAVDPFIMQYADGLPLSDVAWGQLTVDGIGQTARLYMLAIDLSFRTPYLAGVQSSNMASHVVRSLLQAATGTPTTGALGDPSTKVVMLVGSDVNITGLAGLLNLDWMLPTYQPDFCPPGGALVFQLRQSQRTGEYFVRASYIAQTLDQLRNRTPLSLTTPPASAPIFIPGCSTRNDTFDCALADFVSVANRAIVPKFADKLN